MLQDPHVCQEVAKDACRAELGEPTVDSDEKKYGKTIEKPWENHRKMVV